MSEISNEFLETHTDFLLMNLRTIEEAARIAEDSFAVLQRIATTEPKPGISDQIWPALWELAAQAAKVGQMIFPNASGRRDKNAKKLTNLRGKTLSQLLGIEGPKVVATGLRGLRNRYEHHDEDLDDWAVLHGNDYGAVSTGSVSDQDTLGYVPDNLTMFFHYNFISMNLFNNGVKYSMEEMIEAVRDATKNLDGAKATLEEIQLAQARRD